MTTPAPKGRVTPAEQFVERYGVTPQFFVKCCLRPALLAVTRVSCIYRGLLVETLEIPAWKTRLQALRTVLAIAAAPGIEEKRMKIPLGAVGPAQLTAIGTAFFETDWSWATAEFLVKSCLLPAIHAVNIAYLFSMGRLVDLRQSRDWGTQLEALKIVAKVRTLYASEYNNIHFVTYRDLAFLISAARSKKKVIQIVRSTQLVKLR